MKPAPHVVATEPCAPPRVVGIFSRRDEDHELRCILAWRQRTHPAWSQHHVSFAVVETRRAAKRAYLATPVATDAQGYVLAALKGFELDPADTDYQRGYEAALRCVAREGFGIFAEEQAPVDAA